jgi:ABC-2 type transport system ATP-binding protein
VLENLRFFAGAYGLRGTLRRQRIDAALDLAGLADRREQLTRNLPGGIRQRLALASALLHQPKILYLDEPTAGVDPASRRAFWKVIRHLAREGTTLFVTTHHLDEAEYCGRVGLMVDGRLVALDTPEVLKRTHVPGTIHAIGGVTSRQLSDALAGVADVFAIKPFGAVTHVRVGDPFANPQAFAALLQGRGLSAFRVEPAEATLEDVFLELVDRNGAKPADEEAA